MDNKNGFTLTEVMIATAIMVSVMAALVYGLSQSSNLTETTRHQDIAINALQQKLEEIASNIEVIEDYNNPPLNTFDVSGLSPNPAGSVSISEILTDELYDVTVTVGWQQRGAKQISRTLSTTLVKK